MFCNLKNDRVRVAHHMPGRTRIQVPRALRHQAKVAKATRAFAKLPGVRNVEIHVETGSMVLHHDEDPGILMALAKVAEEAFEIALDLGDEDSGAGMDSSILGGLLQSSGTCVDNQISSATGNVLDLKTLIPLGLLGAGIARVSESGLGLANVPAFVLFYYSFDMFVKLHQTKGSPNV